MRLGTVRIGGAPGLVTVVTVNADKLGEPETRLRLVDEQA